MRLCHFADSHIGFRRFQRLNALGGNQIEDDAAAAFNVAVDRIIALAPDLVVVGGDVLHEQRPAAAAAVTMVTGFAKLTRALPDTIVVCASGNHDLSNATRAPGMLTILESLGVHVADRQSRRFYFPERDLSVLAVPDAPGLARPAITPDRRARFNVLVLHGEVQGMLGKKQGGGRAPSEITTDELGLDAWTYVALGHWHQYREIAPNCFYSGSLDYTSSDVWSELSTPKGFIERDLATGAHRFHEIPPSRRYFDLAPIDAHGMTAKQLNAAIQDAASTDIEGAVVRLVVENVDRMIRPALDHKMLRAMWAAALNFNIELRAPEHVESALSMMVRGVDKPGARARTVEQITEDKLAGRELAPDVDRAALIAMAMKYLGDAAERGSDERDTIQAVA